MSNAGEHPQRKAKQSIFKLPYFHILHTLLIKAMVSETLQEFMDHNMIRFTICMFSRSDDSVMRKVNQTQYLREIIFPIKGCLFRYKSRKSL